MWDTESGMLNQVHPVYDVQGDKAIVSMPIADRSAHEWYDPNNKKNYAPLSPLESAAVMVKQIIAHKSCGIDRCYMYYFSNRNFVSASYAEQMLEYDGTLMPYTHAYVYCAKLLDNMTYKSRFFIADTNIVRERFVNDRGRVIDVFWNEGKGLTPLKVDKGVKIYSMMGKELFPNSDKHIFINECPVYFVNCEVAISKTKIMYTLNQ